MNGDEKCPDGRNNTVADSVKGCETSDEADTAICMRNAIKTATGEFWNVYVANEYAQASVKYWAFDNCSVILKSFGR